MSGEGVRSVVVVALEALRDVLPIAMTIAFFQVVVLRRRLAHGRRLALGFVYVLAGLTLFVVGLEEALFPIGRTMAEQLTDPSFLVGDEAAAMGVPASWWQYYWVYAFAAAIGFSAAIAEPALIAVSLKAEEASGGTVRSLPLRVAVATGVAVSVALGAFRIVTGTPLEVYMIGGYLVVVALTVFARKTIVPLAYDSGGVVTSTVTVPLVTALGLGLAATVPGRSPLLDGFGMIALAALSPMIAVMVYARLSDLRAHGRRNRAARQKGAA
ncbi:MAG: DUF1538 domain-containing protein [Thermoleophilia bacterium]|nr:DUF1538 domain-containing protein [Thermoleophilia bacterium]MDH4340881.1 DUF1538 domain-containing protein [Thermoleophilia bacterium]MDH5282211.1 DUF1538 domain-containing protein [Thermoleophilia bacterium]